VAEVDWTAIDTVVCDIDGVIVLGNDPIPGVADALNRLDNSGIGLRFITNNSTKTRAAIARRLAETVGYETSVANIINSGWATGRFIAETVERVYVLGADGLRETLRETGIGVTDDWRAADAVVVGLDFELTFRTLTEASLAVQNGAMFYATNTDHSYPASEGQYPGAGALVAAVSTATGRKPIVCGKPHQPMRDLLAGFAGESPVMIGDRPETDIALGKAMGWATALVLSGVTATAAEVPGKYHPDLVLASLAELPGHMGL
jgi:4-nitrophenyl phosphatase